MADDYEKRVDKVIAKEPAMEKAAAEPLRAEAPISRVLVTAQRVHATPPRVEDVEEEEDLPNMVYESDTDSKSEDKEKTTSHTGGLLRHLSPRLLRQMMRQTQHHYQIGCQRT